MIPPAGRTYFVVASSPALLFFSEVEPRFLSLPQADLQRFLGPSLTLAYQRPSPNKLRPDPFVIKTSPSPSNEEVKART